MHPPAVKSETHLGDGFLGGASASSFIPIPRAGAGNIGGSLETNVPHNFCDNFTNQSRLVCVGIGGGIAPLFLFIPSFHSSEIAHAPQ